MSLTDLRLEELLTYVRSPAVPFTMKCSCGQRLRVATGSWAENGLPCFWAMCAKCSRKPVWCPAGVHIRRQELFKPGITNTGGDKPVPACVTDSCAYRHKEMVDDLDVFLYRPGSEDGWVAAEKWAKRAATGPEQDLGRIAAGQIVRVRRFVREVNPLLQNVISDAKVHGRPVPTLTDLINKAKEMASDAKVHGRPVPTLTDLSNEMNKSAVLSRPHAALPTL